MCGVGPSDTVKLTLCPPPEMSYKVHLQSFVTFQLNYLDYIRHVLPAFLGSSGFPIPLHAHVYYV